MTNTYWMCAGLVALLAGCESSPCPIGTTRTAMGACAASTADAGADGAADLACASGYDHDGDPSTECREWTTCQTGKYVSRQGTPLADRVCAACAPGTFSDSENVSECNAWRECPFGALEVAAGSATRNRACLEVSVFRSAPFAGVPRGDLALLPDSGLIVGSNEFVLDSQLVLHSEGWLRGKTGSGWSREVTRSFQSVATLAWSEPYVALAGTVDVALSAPATPPSAADQYVALVEPDGTEHTSFMLGAAGVPIDLQCAATGCVLVGTVARALDGKTPAGGDDVYVRRMDGSGALIWTQLVGTIANESPTGVLVSDDAIYVAGTTLGSLDGASLGGADVFLRRYDLDGTVAWTLASPRMHSMGSWAASCVCSRPQGRRSRPTASCSSPKRASSRVHSIRTATCGPSVPCGTTRLPVAIARLAFASSTTRGTRPGTTTSRSRATSSSPRLRSAKAARSMRWGLRPV
jgi:TNFR/NGFR cysteine-rich region